MVTRVQAQKGSFLQLGLCQITDRVRGKSGVAGAGHRLGVEGSAVRGMGEKEALHHFSYPGHQSLFHELLDLVVQGL